MSAVLRLASRVVVVAVAVLGLAAPQASAADGAATPDISLAATASAETKRIAAADPEVAAAAANFCGGNYTILLYAERLPTATNRLGTVYTYTNGTSTGPDYNDKPVCAGFFNDTGTAHYMGVRLCDDYTDTPCDEDFGTYSQYAGPVYQNKGYCGYVYSYMEISGKAVVDAKRGSTPCN